MMAVNAHRIEVEPSPHAVRVEIDGVVVADTTRALVLLEGRLPPRYYIPREDLHHELLMPTDTQTECPFKGQAGYFTATVDDHVYDDVAWYYDEPLPEVAAIKGMVSFYNDRVDIYLDDRLVA
jgi:uncharacterized protein (DUF427 family)